MATTTIRPLATRAVMRALVLAGAVVVTGCSVGKATAPSEIGPSGHALGVTVTATPDILPRDGASMSEIKVTVYDAQGAPKGGQRLTLFANAGTLSLGDVVTGSNGQASVTYTAPDVNVNTSEALVSAVPVGDNFDNRMSRNVAIALVGPAIPAAAFSFTPAAPALLEVVIFDASASMLNGSSCGGNCTYSWSFSDGSTKSGQFVQHAFSTAGLNTVTLTVSGPGGTSGQLAKSVVIAPPAAPAAKFTVAPTGPAATVPVTFNASTSTVGSGATIDRYVWDFGDGSPAVDSGAVPVVTKSYASAGTYVVTLTITDSLGRQDTEAVPVTVVP